uniref:ETFB lysine methyltransferase n=1 Tax=Anopheles atroparvus TaxID=41427 RepID=A0A182IY09_ANOAO
LAASTNTRFVIRLAISLKREKRKKIEMSCLARHATNGATASFVVISGRLAARSFHRTATELRSSSSCGIGTDKMDRWGSSQVAASERIPLSCTQSHQSDSDATSVRGKILSNTVLSRQHLTPEIALHLITPECDIYHRPVGADGNDTDAIPFPMDPFWGFFWPGGQALTRFILDTGSLFRGKSVLDVGCGCGASSIAAKMVGASFVTANDIDPVALHATLLNAKMNGITGNADKMDVRSDNLIGDGAVETRYDVVLIGDLFYDTEIAAVLHPWIQRLARAGKKIFIGDPGRHGIAETGVLRNMILKARYALPENVCLENNGFSHASVWQYTLPSEGKE